MRPWGFVNHGSPGLTSGCAVPHLVGVCPWERFQVQIPGLPTCTQWIQRSGVVAQYPLKNTTKVSPKSCRPSRLSVMFEVTLMMMHLGEVVQKGLT